MERHYKEYVYDSSIKPTKYFIKKIKSTVRKQQNVNNHENAERSINDEPMGQACPPPVGEPIIGISDAASICDANCTQGLEHYDGQEAEILDELEMCATPCVDDVIVAEDELQHVSSNSEENHPNDAGQSKFHDSEAMEFDFDPRCDLLEGYETLTNFTVDVETVVKETHCGYDEALFDNCAEDEIPIRNRKWTGLANLKDDETFVKPVTSTVNRSPAEVLLAALKFTEASNLCHTNTAHLMNLLNTISGERLLPDTRYLIDKVLDPKSNVTFHSLCPHCAHQLGRCENLPDTILCPNCNQAVNTKNESDASFVALIDPSDAIIELIKMYWKHYNFVVRERVSNPDVKEDIYDGDDYQRFLAELPEWIRFFYITCIMNADGANRFNAANLSLWPIYITINEIPIEARLRNVIPVMLWFGRGKPPMNAYLELYVNFMNSLCEKGISCVINGEERLLRLFTLISSVDTMARAPMGGSSQCNAYYGCDWCEILGEHEDGCVRYPHSIDGAPLRTRESTLEYAEKALAIGEAYRGITSASPLLYLYKFFWFVPEYMHFYLLGAVKQILDYILPTLTKDQLEYIDQIIERIRVPNQCMRLARKLTDRKNWKAKEYENFALYYSMPIFIVVLQNERVLRHWSQLVSILHICISSKITRGQINELRIMCREFVKETGALYSVAANTYNIHQFEHLADAIESWGPASVFSAFCFEAANHDLLKVIRSAKGVILQILRGLSIQRSVKVLESVVYPHCSGAIIKFCESMSSRGIRNSRISKGMRYLGCHFSVEDELIAQFNLPKQSRVYNKIIMNGHLFMSTERENVRSCNYYARLKNSSFVKIHGFIVDESTSLEVTVCQVINTRDNDLVPNIKSIDFFERALTLVQTVELDRACVMVSVGLDSYIIPTPNQLYY